MTEASALVGLLLATVLTLSNSCVHCNTPRSLKIKWQGVLKLLQWDLFSVNFLNSRKKKWGGVFVFKFWGLSCLKGLWESSFSRHPENSELWPQIHGKLLFTWYLGFHSVMSLMASFRLFSREERRKSPSYEQFWSRNGIKYTRKI